jgi:hypothetical protein
MSTSAGRQIVWIHGRVSRKLIRKSANDCNGYLVLITQFIHTWTGAVFARWNKIGATDACGEYKGTHKVICILVSKSGMAP